MIDDATLAQRKAADPDQSTWLSANAGSGKTKVLTDRVARLLLNGVEPQHILCLTYTKAAASEMQNRLFAFLGRWAMLPDAELAPMLAALGEGIEVGADRLAAARRLFARAIETPGGLRILTIHSFCAALLRRFPLEAGVGPGFRELDDRSARLMREEIAEDLAGGPGRAAMAALARISPSLDLTVFLDQLAGSRGGLEPALGAPAIRALFGLKPGDTPDAVAGGVMLGGEAGWWPELLAALAAGGTTDARAGVKLADVTPSALRFDDLALLEEVFLTGKGAKEPFTAKIGSFPTKALREGRLVPVMPEIDALMARVQAARPLRLALAAAERAVALHDYAAVFLPEYARRKAQGGWLDFDDLIERTIALLTDPSVAAWVLYRLDGGIDHILVDEAQDTSPEQWQVIELLAAEFTSGAGAREEGRTLFVVGDRKQSIYSFQGADVAAFEEKRQAFKAKIEAVGRPFQSRELLHSFRSSPAILRAVDAALGPLAEPALGGEVRHLAQWEGLPGRVDLWPLIGKAEKTEDGDWTDPVDLVTDAHHDARLAAMIADEIAAMIATGVQIDTGRGVRRVHAGDVLILVQRRSTLFAEVIRACKARGLPVAGADRLKLGAEIAVKDLTALLAFLATPDDDLSLAAVLRSPLCGWSEGDLFRLAQPRPGRLWQALRGVAAAPGLEMLHDLRDQADFLRPFELIDRVLTRHDGRRKLVARLGPEAEDGIDELLNQALAYEQVDVPSLTGFLAWLGSDEIEVKRRMEGEGDRIRVMTVHGAKGLEAPIVILPDTADRRPRDSDLIVPLAGGQSVWRMPAEESPPAIAAAQAARRAASVAENLRLLYVAMTRAKSWLIVCGAGAAEGEGAWHRIIAEGLSGLGAVPLRGGRLRLAHGDWPADAPGHVAAAAVRPDLPDWARHPAPAMAGPVQPVSPSNLGGEKALPGEGGLPEELAKARGTALHALLEHMPLLPPSDWPALARDLVADAAERQLLMNEAEAVLTHGALFGAGSLAEVPVSAWLEGKPLYGIIDRLVVGPDHVLAVDYKSNRVVPARPEDVPEGLLRQMGAYAEALAQIYPDRRVETALLWTSRAQLMRLPPEIVRDALSRATIP